MTKIMVFWLVVLWSALAFAQEGLSQPESYLHQGDMLTMEEDYYRAITAYKSFLITADSADPRRDDVVMRIAWIYSIADKPDAAIDTLRPLVARGEDLKKAPWARLRLAQVLLKSTAAASGRNALERLVADCEALQAPDCRLISTEARLSLAGFYTDSFRFELAASQLALVPGEATIAKDAYRVSDYLRTLDIPSKDPALAGVLSAVPGLGHVYLGDYGVAALALIWNGLFIFATVDAVVDQQWGQAALLGTLEMIWYSGTIYGAVAGAHRFNRDANRIVRDGLKRDLDALDDDTPWARGLSNYPNFKLKMSF